MGLYSTLKHTAQYLTLSVAMLAGVGAGHVSQKYEKQPVYQRKPCEPCVLPPEHRKEEKPVKIPLEVVYFGLAAIAVAGVAHLQRKRADSFIVNRPDSPKNFFGSDEF